MTDTAEIGVFGGSGFYSLLEDVREVKVDTPYGAPSDSIFLAEVAGRRVAFLPRHGRRHTIPPHKINYRANVWAMRSLGVKAAISPCAAGSLQLAVKPGDFVVCDQFVDRTTNRIDTFFDGPIVTHLSSAEIYDPVLRQLAIDTIRDHGIEVHERGTVVVIGGPRFSTKSESKWFSDAGWEVINMTQYPEAWLCRELGMAVVNISLITDYDAGVHEGTEAVNAMSVLEVFQQNASRIQAVVLDLIGRFPADLDSLGRAGRAGADPRRRARDVVRGHPAVRDGSLGWGDQGGLPIGVCLRAIRAEPLWWLESARRLEAAGYKGLWCWDHFMGKGDPTVPVVEDWTILAMAAAQTERVTVGPFVLNVMNRHPALVARMASTLQIASGGRLILGIGIGGAPREHAAYGMAFPEPAERRARLEEAIAVIRALWTGRSGHARVAVLPAGGRRGVPDPEPAAADHHRGRDAGRGAAGRVGSATAGAPSTSTSRRTCRSTSNRWRRPGATARTSG